MNRIYVCPWCGSVFGKVKTPRANEEWYPYRRACAECPDWPSRATSHSWPGSQIDWFIGVGPPMEDPFEGLTHDDLLEELDLLARALTSDQSRCDNSDQLEAQMTAELTTRIAELRSKSVTGKITDGELKEALTLMREGRVAAFKASAKAKAKKAGGPAVDTEKLTGMFNLG